MRDAVDRDCRVGLAGLLQDRFRGVWVSDPKATEQAENKIVQLRAALDVGLRIPETLVSQDVRAIREFCLESSGPVIVKALRGTDEAHLFTHMVTPDVLADDEALAWAPEIYQRYVPGTDHLRVHVFGGRVSVVRIRSEELDWRRNLDVPVDPVAIQPDLATALRRLVRGLGLRMAIIDLKVVGASGPAVFLDLNPQGQFLWVEAIGKVNLTDRFVAFIESLLVKVRAERSGSPR